MAYTLPTVDDFKSRFDRDFAFCSPDDQTTTKFVRDIDITRALTLAGANINDSLWENQPLYTEARLLLAAHYLCTNIFASSQGLGGQGEWLRASKALGPATEAFAIPPRILKSPSLGLLSKTLYGCIYLQMVAPRLVGAVFVAQGGTTP